jgi:RNA processing factor Prp31
MTSSESCELESQVISNLEIMLARYQTIDELADRMLAKQEKGQAIQTDLQTLQLERESLITFEQQARPTTEAYRNTRSEASDSVKKLTAQTANLVQGLMVKIAKLEESARESYKRLFPEINQNLRSHQMKQAYGKSQT